MRIILNGFRLIVNIKLPCCVPDAFSVSVVARSVESGKANQIKNHVTPSNLWYLPVAALWSRPWAGDWPSVWPGSAAAVRETAAPSASASAAAAPASGGCCSRWDRCRDGWTELRPVWRPDLIDSVAAASFGVSSFACPGRGTSAATVPSATGCYLQFESDGVTYWQEVVTKKRTGARHGVEWNSRKGSSGLNTVLLSYQIVFFIYMSTHRYGWGKLLLIKRLATFHTVQLSHKI